jgi:hypothetical protein
VNAGDLQRHVFVDFAHFSAMQVQGGGIRGLDLHLARLRSGSMELFGQALPDERVRSYLRTALQAGPGDVSLRATLYSPAVDFTVDRAEPGVLVQVGAPACGARLPGPAPPGLRGRTAYRAMTTRPHRRIVAIAAPRACERTARRKTPE